MKVLLNCSTLVKGGSLQVAVSFIRQALHKPCGIEWHFAVSREVLDELTRYGVGKNLSTLRLIKRSPARNSEARKTLKELEEAIAPVVVFTIFGPAYVIFRAPHLCGVGNGWVTHSTWLAFKTLGSLRRSLGAIAGLLYKAYWYHKADFWITEAAVAKNGLVRRLSLPSENIAIVQNTCGQEYIDSEGVASFPNRNQRVRILCLSAYYPHKNLQIIPSVAKALRQADPDLDFEFVVTLPADSDGLSAISQIAKRLGVTDRIQNYGRVSVADGPMVYRSCHIAFLPSVLETFSANYPEAMATGRPIVTTDLGFAREICKRAALYYQPMNAAAAAATLLTLCRDEVLWMNLIREGKRVLQELPTPDSKYEQYVKCILDLQKRFVR